MADRERERERERWREKERERGKSACVDLSYKGMTMQFYIIAYMHTFLNPKVSGKIHL